jgi:hypothetical protein
MKTAIALLALTIAAATPAAADSTLAMRLFPPKQYDHPYKGELTFVLAENEQEVREMCPGSKFNPRIGALGCAHVGATWCRVIMAPDSVITRAGFLSALVLRHEFAHCNGWPADHRDALSFVDWAKTASKNYPDLSRIPFTPNLDLNRLVPRRGR